MREGGERGKERKLINSNHRALIPQRAKDRPARLRLTALATAPFVTRGEKPRNRTCVRNGDSQRDFSRLGFPGVSTDRKKCIRLLAGNCPSRNENAAVVATAVAVRELARGRRDRNIFSAFLG